MDIQPPDIILIAASIFLGIVLIGLLFSFFKIRKSGRIARSLNMTTLSVSVPKEIKRQDENVNTQREAIAVMEQLFAGLSNIREGIIKRLIYGPFYLSFEIATPIDSNEIFFYISIPKKFREIIEKQIQSFYPAAEVKVQEDYNIFVPNGGSAAAYMTLKKSHIFPIKTYQKLESDPLNNITNALSKIPRGEGAAFQMIIKPAGTGWQAQCHKAVKRMQEGKGFNDAYPMSSGAGGMINNFLEIAFTSAKTKNKEEEKIVKLSPAQEEIIKDVESKAGKVGFETNIRLIASGPTKEKAELLLAELENSFSQFDSPDLNSLKIVEPKWSKIASLNQTVYNFIFRHFNSKRKIILNTEELTSIFHFPIAATETPQVKWLRAKQAPPPVNILSEGLVLGHSVYRGEDAVIKIGREDRRRHLYAVGQTGTGKSAFLGELIKRDIKNGEGVCVIDPHGDLAEDILNCVPAERAEDVILFNPADTAKPIGLNLLEYDENYPEQKTFVINEMIKIFDKLYDLKTTGGPMFEQYMRNAMLLIMDDPASGSTLIEISRVLSDADFRKFKLSKCRNPIVKDFWEKEAEKAGAGEYGSLHYQQADPVYFQ
jgi:hypothetical protein